MLYAEITIKRKFLCHVPDPVPGFARRPLQIEPVDAGFTIARLQRATKHLEGGGLSGSIWSKQSKDLTSLHRKRDMISRHEVSETLSKRLSLDRGVAVIRFGMYLFCDVCFTVSYSTENINECVLQPGWHRPQHSSKVKPQLFRGRFDSFGSKHQPHTLPLDHSIDDRPELERPGQNF